MVHIGNPRSDGPPTSRQSSRMSARRLSLISTLSGVLLLASPFGCGAGQPCVNTETARLPSPDGSRDLVLFVRRCETGYSGEVAIVPKSKPVPDGPGNVVLPGHPMNVTARWSTVDTVILASPDANPSPQQTRVDGITVLYVRQ